MATAVIETLRVAASPEVSAERQSISTDPVAVNVTVSVKANGAQPYLVELVPTANVSA